MHRCLRLAKQGAGYVAPNPLVGAVLVYESRIIGEGYHQKYGGPHAEVNCINSVKDEDKDLISRSTLYVSLEPCAHFGKTPPCSDLIIGNQIPEVIIGSRDPFSEVNGKGIEKLRIAGVHVIEGILEKECKELNKRFFIFHTQHRPYIILKWAETADRKLAALNPPGWGNPASNSLKRLLISNEQTNRLVHKWRSEEASILVGTNTALYDDPELNTRYWTGPSPIRLVVDMDLRLPSSLRIFNGKQRTIIFNTIKHSEELTSAELFSPLRGQGQGLMYYQVTEDVSLVHQILNALYHLKVQSVLVEGGARLLQSFIDDNLWDEVRIIKNEKLIINDGLAAPDLKLRTAIEEMKILDDSIKIYSNGLG